MPVQSCQSDGKPGFKYGESGHCYTYTPGNEESKKRAHDKAVKQGQAIEINRHKGESMSEQFMLSPAELQIEGETVAAHPGSAVLRVGKPFMGFHTGDFTDMLGREISISKTQMAEYVENTKRAIDATKDSLGSAVGLPIDPLNHDKGNAAGWIVGIDLSEDGEGLVFHPRWTELGVELISKGLQRFFSATFNPDKKVISGGTLTNWPASRDDNGFVIIEPIELSSEGGQRLFDKFLNLFTRKGGTPVFDGNSNQNGGKTVMPNTLSLTIPEDSPILKLLDVEEGGTASLNMQNLDGVISELAEKKAGKLVEAATKKAETEKHVEDFIALALPGGSAANLLPLDPEVVRSTLLRMSEEDRTAVINLMETVAEKGTVVFEEEGHDDEVEGKTPLPEYIKKKLASEELSLKDLTNPMLGLGDLSEYDLSEFSKKEDK